MRTGLVWDEMTMWHDSGNRFGPRNPWIEPVPALESVASKRRIKNLLDASGMTALLHPVSPRTATEEELLRVHDRAYLERVRAVSAHGGGNISRIAHTHIGEGGYEIAARGAGCAIAAVEAVLDGEVDNAYSLARPPGHHAERDEGKGFCIFNNAAVAARHAIAACGLSRIAIVDFDAHHGNGAQSIFWENPAVLTVSVHQDRAFPQSIGAVTERGAGGGLGYNINVPLPAGSGEPAYLAAFDRVVLPALETFRPDLIVAACGFDAGFMDPSARMQLGSGAFRAIAARLMDAAGRLCANRLVMVHEGGYELHTVPFMALAVIEQLSGRRSGIEDPFLAAIVAGQGDTAPLPHESEVVAAAEQAMKAHPPTAERRRA